MSMDLQNKLIAGGGIIVALVILGIGFNKLTPDTYQDNSSFSDRLRSTTLGWKNTYPESKYPESKYPESIYEETSYPESKIEPRKSSWGSSTGIIVGGTLCNRCYSKRHTRRK